MPSKENQARRNLEAQLEAGQPDRQRTDDGGHLFATSFGGSREAINLTAQSRSQNRSEAGQQNWRRTEETW